MNVASPLSPATAKRLSRLSLWLCLTVTWFAAHVLGRLAPHAASRALAQYAHAARLLLVARALQQTAPRRRTQQPVETRRLTVRRVVGATLRCALRRGTPAERARALCAMLAAPERWIAHIARRLRRRFTKLARLPTPRITRVRVIAPAKSARIHGVNSS